MSLITTGVLPGESTSKIITLNLSGYRKVRIWRGEMPELNYENEKVLERTLAAKETAIAQVRGVAIEMLIPTGGRYIYGFLEAEFTPTNSGKLSVKVGIYNRGNPIDWSLAASVDEVYAGLTSEYSESVMEGAVSVAEILGSGILCFERATHGIAGSSPRIFRQLAATSVQLLACSFEPSEDKIAEIIVRCFSK